MMRFILAKCPIDMEQKTISDWWYVCSRHHDIDAAEEALSKVSREKQITHTFRIFLLAEFSAGQQFNIKRIRQHE